MQCLLSNKPQYRNVLREHSLWLPSRAGQDVALQLWDPVIVMAASVGWI